MASAEASNKVKQWCVVKCLVKKDSKQVDHWELTTQLDDALSKTWVYEWYTALTEMYNTVQAMSPLAANTSHRNSTKKLRSLFWTAMFWHEIIQANVSVMNVQIILSEHFHFYKLISRWVPEMTVQILTTFVHKFSGFVHSTFITFSHLTGGEGMQNSKMGLACHEAEGVQPLKVPRP